MRLSLGDLVNVGDVELNGRPAGVVRMRGRAPGVTALPKPGFNEITMKVSTTLINRVAGWTQAPPLPPDPAAIYAGNLRDARQVACNAYGFEPLPRSGLLGPVTLSVDKVVPF